MRITFVLPPVNMSGGIKVVAIYAKLLKEKGHDVFLISSPPRVVPLRRKIKALIKNGRWPVEPIKASHFDYSGLNVHVLDCHRAPTDGDVPTADIIIATWWETAEWVNALSHTKGVKVYFIQGHEIYSYLPLARCQATYKMPLHKIVVGSWLRKVMLTEYGDAVVDLVPNSVDHNQFFAAPRGKQPVPTLGFLYSPTKIKGVEVTLTAISSLRDRFPNLRVIAFGVHVPEFEPGFDSRIEFHHFPPQENIRSLYAQCDVWVTASRMEGFNLPAIEAMACRTPVVSTKTGWPEEVIVNGENGFLVDVDDVAALVKSTASVLSFEDEAWHAMSQKAFDTVKNGSWETSTNLFEKALRHACHRARSGELSSALSLVD
jgi:glycosyltransferase involved in cell wall biosynthesis